MNGIQTDLRLPCVEEIPLHYKLHLLLLLEKSFYFFKFKNITEPCLQHMIFFLSLHVNNKKEMKKKKDDSSLCIFPVHGYRRRTMAMTIFTLRSVRITIEKNMDKKILHHINKFAVWVIEDRKKKWPEQRRMFVVHCEK